MKALKRTDRPNGWLMTASFLFRPYALVVFAVFVTAAVDFWSATAVLQSQRLGQISALFERFAREQVTDLNRLKDDVELIAPGSLFATANLSLHAGKDSDELILRAIPQSLLYCLSNSGRVCRQGSVVAIKLNQQLSAQVGVATIAHPASRNLAAFIFGTATVLSTVFVLISLEINHFFSRRPIAAIEQIMENLEPNKTVPLRSSLLLPVPRKKTPTYPFDLREVARTISKASLSLARSKQAVAEQERQHLKWLGYLSHDLSLPLWRVQKRLEALQYDSTLSEDQKLRLLESAQLDITQSMEVIGSISQFAALESDIERSFVDVELRKLLEYAVDVFEFQACNQGVELDLHIGCGVGAARVERSLIRRAIENLISNALRFTPEGGLVSIDAAQADGMIHISIADSGLGIPEKELPHIFDFAFRGQEQPRPSSIGSFGIGLALVKRVAEVHHGTVVARNLEPQGAEFTISIPVKF